MWRPVESAIVQTLKQRIGKMYRDWLDTENNADRWFAYEQSFSAMGQKILMTHWAGESCKPFIEEYKICKKTLKIFSKSSMRINRRWLR